MEKKPSRSCLGAAISVGPVGRHRHLKSKQFNFEKTSVISRKIQEILRTLANVSITIALLGKKCKPKPLHGKNYIVINETGMVKVNCGYFIFELEGDIKIVNLPEW
jgi:hypothetical protein